MRVLTLTAMVTPERILTIQVPEDVPTGPAEVVVVFTGETPSQMYPKLGDLRTSEFFGMWRDREDLPDSPILARKLRAEAWSRSDDDLS
jgi:hypothetical protein